MPPLTPHTTPFLADAASARLGGGITLELARADALDSGSVMCVLPEAARLCARTIFPPEPVTETGMEALASALAPSLARLYGLPRGPAAPVRAALAIARNADGQLVGLSGIALETLPVPTPMLAASSEPVARIAYVAVEPALRRRGIAWKLVRICEHVARTQWGEASVCLFVKEGNAGARALYQSLGYVNAGPPLEVHLPVIERNPNDGSETLGKAMRLIEPMRACLAPPPLGARLRRKVRRTRMQVSCGLVKLIKVLLAPALVVTRLLGLVDSSSA